MTMCARRARNSHLHAAASVLLLLGVFTDVRVAAANYASEIQSFEASDAVSFPAPSGNLFVGSSTFRLWPALATDMAPAPVIQRGFGGAQMDDVLYYLDRIITPYRARRLLLLAGGDDLAAGRTPQQIVNDFASIEQRVRATSSTQIYLLSIKASPARQDLLPRMRETNTLFINYASTHGVTYVDVFTPMFKADGTLNTSLYGSDQLHLNAAGYQLWTSIIRPYLAPNTLPEPLRRDRARAAWHDPGRGLRQRRRGRGLS